MSEKISASGKYLKFLENQIVHSEPEHNKIPENLIDLLRYFVGPGMPCEFPRFDDPNMRRKQPM